MYGVVLLITEELEEEIRQAHWYVNLISLSFPNAS